jgi:hypothetical protein
MTFCVDWLAIPISWGVTLTVVMVLWWMARDGALVVVGCSKREENWDGEVNAKCELLRKNVVLLAV